VTGFFVTGIALAAWAVILAALGLTRPAFPGGPRGKRAVMAISIALVTLTIASGIVGGVLEGSEEGEAAAPVPAARG
jgi:hypothetical protein